MNASMIKFVKPGKPVFHHTMETPLGALTLVEQSGKLIGTNFGESPLAGVHDLKALVEMGFVPQQTTLLEEAVKQLSEYFSGQRRVFSLPLNPQGTPFRQRAWQALLQIPYGRTASYAEQAEKIGGKNYCRAVGQANHHNPIAIMIPCHRVIGKNGALTGYASGLGNKEWLLKLEATHLSA
ncbi:MAG: methylated-DNA--[protein]-cysteine S-methyltransferase [bacterium]